MAASNSLAALVNSTYVSEARNRQIR